MCILNLINVYLFGMHKNCFDWTDVWNVTTTTIIVTYRQTEQVQHNQQPLHTSHMLFLLYELRRGNVDHLRTDMWIKGVICKEWPEFEASYLLLCSSYR